MPDYSIQPLTFREALDYLTNKVSLPVGLSSREIAATLSERARNQAFFSAKVTSFNILDKLKEVCNDIADGTISVTRGREILRDFLGNQGLGYTTPGESADRDVRKLPSTARLNLIMRQNVAMAHAIGQREVAEHPAVMEVLPNYKYVAVGDGQTRDTHAELDGLILPKTDPFWDTHFPPWEFNCRCMVIETDEPVNGRAAITAQDTGGGDAATVQYGRRTVEVQPNESGYVFRSRPSELHQDPDTAGIKDPSLRSLFARLMNSRRTA